MTTLQRDVERMLRWYPQRWRQQHGDALVGLHLDNAEASGSEGAPLSREDQAAMRAAGLFEHTRHSAPIVFAVLGTLSIISGMVLNAIETGALGTILWLVCGPALLSMSIWALRASRDGRWSFATVVPAITSVVATLVFISAFQVGMLRDDVGAVPPLELLLALEALTAAFIGVTFAIPLTPAFVRGGMKRDWALTLAFLTGFFGSMPIVLGVMSGIAPVLAGVGLTYLGIRSARRSVSSPTLDAPQLEGA